MTSTPKTSHLIHCHDAFFFFLAPKIDTCAKLFDQMMGVISMDEKKKLLDSHLHPSLCSNV